MLSCILNEELTYKKRSVDDFNIIDHMKIGALSGALFISINSLHSIWGVIMLLLQIIISGIVAAIPDLDHPSGKINQTILGINKKYFLTLVYSSLGMVFIYFGNGFTGYLYGGYLILMGFSRHRGFTHSLIAAIWFYLICRAIFIAPIDLKDIFSELIGIFKLFKNSLVWNHVVIKAAVIGYLSHLISDFVTNHGVEVAWPNEKNFRYELFDEGNIGVLYTMLASVIIFSVLIQVL